MISKNKPVGKRQWVQHNKYEQSVLQPTKIVSLPQNRSIGIVGNWVHDDESGRLKQVWTEIKKES